MHKPDICLLSHVADQLPLASRGEYCNAFGSELHFERACGLFDRESRSVEETYQSKGLPDPGERPAERGNIGVGVGGPGIDEHRYGPIYLDRRLNDRARRHRVRQHGRRSPIAQLLAAQCEARLVDVDAAVPGANGGPVTESLDQPDAIRGIVELAA